MESKLEQNPHFKVRHRLKIKVKQEKTYLTAKLYIKYANIENILYILITEQILLQLNVID